MYVDAVTNLEQIYNDRRLFFGTSAGLVPNDNFGSLSPNADKRGNRAKGTFRRNYDFGRLLISSIMRQKFEIFWIIFLPSIS